MLRVAALAEQHVERHREYRRKQLTLQRAAAAAMEAANNAAGAAEAASILHTRVLAKRVASRWLHVLLLLQMLQFMLPMRRSLLPSGESPPKMQSWPQLRPRQHRLSLPWQQRQRRRAPVLLLRLLYVMLQQRRRQRRRGTLPLTLMPLRKGP